MRLSQGEGGQRHQCTTHRSKPQPGRRASGQGGTGGPGSPLPGPCLQESWAQRPAQHQGLVVGTGPMEFQAWLRHRVLDSRSGLTGCSDACAQLPTKSACWPRDSNCHLRIMPPVGLQAPCLSKPSKGHCQVLAASRC